MKTSFPCSWISSLIEKVLTLLRPVRHHYYIMIGPVGSFIKTSAWSCLVRRSWTVNPLSASLIPEWKAGPRRHLPWPCAGWGNRETRMKPSRETLSLTENCILVGEHETPDGKEGDKDNNERGSRKNRWGRRTSKGATGHHIQNQQSMHRLLPTNKLHKLVVIMLAFLIWAEGVKEPQAKARHSQLRPDRGGTSVSGWTQKPSAYKNKRKFSLAALHLLQLSYAQFRLRDIFVC